MFTKTHKLYLIGSGNLANSLAAHFKKYNIKFDWFETRKQGRYFESSDELSTPTLYLLAINESNLDNLCKKITNKNPNSLYCHFSASLGFDVFPKKLLKNAFILHPMQTFPSPDKVIDIANCYFTFQADSKLYMSVKTDLNSIGIHTLFLELKNRQAYHLIGVFASNFLIALLSICEQLGRVNNLSKEQVTKLVQPLINQTLSNSTSFDLKDALSGPLKRNENSVIKSHEIFLKEFDPNLFEIYTGLNKHLQKILKQDK